MSSYQLPKSTKSPVDTDLALQHVDVGTSTATLTTEQLMAGILYSAPVGAIVLTTPTAADLVAIDTGKAVGRGFHMYLRNDDDLDAITVAVGAGFTLYGSDQVTAGVSSHWYVRYTNISEGTEAVSLIRLA